MNSEKFTSSDRSCRSEHGDSLEQGRNTLSRALLAASISLGALAHDGRSVEAREVQKGSSWNEYIQALDHDANTASREQAAAILVKKNGETSVIDQRYGGALTVTIDYPAQQRVIEQEVSSGNAEAICSAHVHTTATGLQILRKMGSEVGPLIPRLPPSATDVTPYHLLISSDFGTLNIRYISAVKDAVGMSYYKSATEPDLKRYPEIYDDSKKWQTFMGATLPYMMSRIDNLSEGELVAAIPHFGALSRQLINSSSRGMPRAEYKEVVREYFLKETIENNPHIVSSVFKGRAELQQRYARWQQEIKIRLQRLESDRLAYALNSTHSVPTAVQTSQLQYSYLKNSGFLMRYATNKEIAEEPPCPDIVK